MGKFGSKFIDICKEEGLAAGDDALVMKSYISAFAYHTRDMHKYGVGQLIDGKKRFVVKYEDLLEVLSSISYPAGGIVVEGFYKKIEKEGGYDLAFNQIVDLPAEYPSSLNDSQLVALLKECKKKGNAHIVDYVEEHNSNGLISEIFMHRITPIVIQMDLKTSEMERFEDVRNKINFSVIKKNLVEDTTSMSLLKKAGLK